MAVGDPSHHARVRLLEVEPDLAAFMSSDERAEARRVTVPVSVVGPGPLDVDELLDESDAFGAVILNGVLLRRLTVASQPGMRLLGPGDIISRLDGGGSALLSHVGHRVVGELRLALLDDRILLTAQHFPRLFVGLHRRMADQQQRIATQMVICQLPRVDQRILSLMWLLAESWGRVRTSGVWLPLALTHDALGELIGARRPTVSLAVKELSERDALVRQDGGWLILEPIAMPTATTWSDIAQEAVAISAPADGSWASDPLVAFAELPSAAMKTHLETLSDRHARVSGETTDRLAAAQQIRERSIELRRGIARRRASPPPAPSKR